MSGLVTCTNCDEKVDQLRAAQCPNCGSDLWSLDSSASERTTSREASPCETGRLKVAVGNREFIVDDGETVGLGRSTDYPHSQCFADRDNVSRVHAILRFNAGRVYVTDTDSANGTYINGRRLSANSEYELQQGQRLRLATDVELGLDWRSPPHRGAMDSGGRTRIEET